MSDEEIMKMYRQMDGIIGYTKTERKVLIGGKEALESHIRPVFINEEARLRAMQRIKCDLYDIFSKYSKKADK